MEPVDLSKKARIEDELAAELEDAITKVGKLRKRQPLQCRQKSKAIAESTLKYYSKCQVDMAGGKSSSLLEGVEVGGAETLAADLAAVSEGLSQASTAQSQLKETMALYRAQLDLDGGCQIVNVRSAHLSNPDYVQVEDSL